jgi:hypothetical protein
VAARDVHTHHRDAHCTDWHTLCVEPSRPTADRETCRSTYRCPLPSGARSPPGRRVKGASYEQNRQS